MAAEPAWRNGFPKQISSPSLTHLVMYLSAQKITSPANVRMASGSVMNEVTLAEPISTPRTSATPRATPSVTRLDLAWAVLACTAVPLSLLWDFSWESSIGVDRFWSPPHLATHVGVWLSGLLGLRLILRLTLARRRRDVLRHPGLVDTVQARCDTLRRAWHCRRRRALQGRPAGRPRRGHRSRPPPGGANSARAGPSAA